MSSYVDEALLVRRPSQPEDDNPPSPIALSGISSDDFNFAMDFFLFLSNIFVAFIVDDITSATGLRFPAPHTPPSNPLTPASPHTSSSSFLQV